MGNNGVRVEGLPSPPSIKVHARMCSELQNSVIRISKIIEGIEAARPHASGIDALCLLKDGVVKAKSLLQHCSESSILYLVLTGDAIVSRCNKSRNLMEQSLSQIRNVVPVILASKISGIILALRSAAFCLDPPEEEARKLLRELLHRYGSTIDSTERFALSSIHAVFSWFRISSHKALVVEKRSIRCQLDKLRESEQSKRKILRFFLGLLNKYIIILTEEQKDNGSAEHKDSLPFASPYSEVQLHVNCRSDETETNMSSRPTPPKEFICPLSSRLMHDPVVIASGHTYERTWIQKWFDEGHDTCPKTNMKLAYLSYTANYVMQEVILKWCATHSFPTPDAKIPEALDKSWETSTNSTDSLGSSMNNLNLPLEFNNFSVGSSAGSDPSYTKITNNVKPSHQIDREFGAISLDSHCNVVEDVKRLLKISEESWSMMPFGKLIQLLFRFLKDAGDRHDMEAQITGFLYLSELLQKKRNIISYMKEDAYGLLASFLDTEVAKQALSILEVLSFHQHCGYKIAASGAIAGILNILDSQVQELLEPALNILTNMSIAFDIGSFVLPSELIPKLIPLFENRTLARYCVTILKNLRNNGDTIVSIAGACSPSIAKLLENDSHEKQEQAVSTLLSLCSQRVQYCQLVMGEGVVLGLVNVSVNGNKKAQGKAKALLQILGDESCTTGENPLSNIITDSSIQKYNF